jgi:hypothetical protein
MHSRAIGAPRQGFHKRRNSSLPIGSIGSDIPPLPMRFPAGISGKI